MRNISSPCQKLTIYVEKMRLRFSRRASP